MRIKYYSFFQATGVKNLFPILVTFDSDTYVSVKRRFLIASLNNQKTIAGIELPISNTLHKRRINSETTLPYTKF